MNVQQDKKLLTARYSWRFDGPVMIKFDPPSHPLSVSARGIRTVSPWSAGTDLLSVVRVCSSNNGRNYFVTLANDTHAPNMYYSVCSIELEGGGSHTATPSTDCIDYFDAGTTVRTFVVLCLTKVCHMRTSTGGALLYIVPLAFLWHTSATVCQRFDA